jgi:hypothetical protein
MAGPPCRARGGAAPYNAPMLRPRHLAILLLALSPALRAQEALPAPAPDGPPEPAVRRDRIEDDNARIDELRVRGQVKRIQVQPKLAGRPYEVLPVPLGRDTSSDGTRGAAGQSVWHFLTF